MIYHTSISTGMQTFPCRFTDLEEVSSTYMVHFKYTTTVGRKTQGQNYNPDWLKCLIFKEHFQNTHAFLDKMSSPIPKSNFSCSLLICLLNLLCLFHKYSHTVPHVHQDLLYPMNFIYLFICCILYVLSTKYVLVEVEMADNHSTHHYLTVLPSLYVMVTITYWSALFV